MTTTATAAEQLFKSVGESITKTFDFTKWLGTGETLASVTSVTQTNDVEATALTLGDPALNAAEITINGVAIAANKAVQVLVSVGVDGVEYVLTAEVVTSTPQTFKLNGTLLVSNT